MSPEAALASAPVRRGAYGESTKSGRQAQHSTEILRVADLVEHEDPASARNRVGQLHEAHDVGLGESLDGARTATGGAVIRALRS
jgi:hypothetical protein